MLRKHPLHKIVTCTGTLKAAPTIQNWGELAEITLCQVITEEVVKFRKCCSLECGMTRLEEISNKRN